MPYHFISFSNADGKPFSERLRTDLMAGSPPETTWLQGHDLQAGIDYEEQIFQAIQLCETLLFVMTPDSVGPQSGCKLECVAALKYKKPVIPLRFHPDAVTPDSLGLRQHVDFTAGYEQGLAKLREHLGWRRSPTGELWSLREQLEDLRRNAARTGEPEKLTRYRRGEQDLSERIAELEEMVAPGAGSGQDIAPPPFKAPRVPVGTPGAEASVIAINPASVGVPTYFQDRYVETGRVVQFLRDDSKRLMTLVGRPGVGKSVLVCRLLAAVRSGHFPDDYGAFESGGCIYFTSNGTHRASMAGLYSDLVKLLRLRGGTGSAGRVQRLEQAFLEPAEGVKGLIRELVDAYQGVPPVVVFFDNFEDALTADWQVREDDLGGALAELIRQPQHPVRVILATRVAPGDLLLIEPGRQARLDLDHGLPPGDAKRLLRDLDQDGRASLRDAPEALLDAVVRQTRGFPRALEAFHAILMIDADQTLASLVRETAGVPPLYVVELLVGEAFSRLDPAAQRVMEVLAVYGRPVQVEAVDAVLRAYASGYRGAPFLKRLVNLKLVRKERENYYLHSVDRAYALSRIPEGGPGGGATSTPPAFTKPELRRLAAEYLKSIRKDRTEWTSVENLEPQVAEFEVRCEGGWHEEAARLLLEIDLDFLSLWGRSRDALRMHDGLDLRQLTETPLRWQALYHRGILEHRVGADEAAVEHLTMALRVARDLGDALKEASCLVELGDYHLALNRFPEASGLARKAVEIADRLGEPAVPIKLRAVGHLGSVELLSGQSRQAIPFQEQAVALARTARDPREENFRLGILGLCYANLGQGGRAKECYREALGIARRISDRLYEGLHTGNLAEAALDEKAFPEVLELATQAARIGEEVGSPAICNGCYRAIALAQTHLGNLDDALAAAEQAVRQHTPLYDHLSQAVLGLVSLLRRDHDRAEEAFTRALDFANGVTAGNPWDYSAYDTEGLAHSGLAVLEGGPHREHAQQAYCRARKLTAEDGIITRALTHYEPLGRADSGNALEGMTDYITGRACQG
jgi:tetratricopeptide (TPR) repeat protein